MRGALKTIGVDISAASMSRTAREMSLSSKTPWRLTNARKAATRDPEGQQAIINFFKWWVHYSGRMNITSAFIMNNDDTSFVLQIGKTWKTVCGHEVRRPQVHIP